MINPHTMKKIFTSLLCLLTCVLTVSAQSLVLNGSDQYMSIPNHAAFLPTDDGGYTVTCRVKSYDYFSGGRIVSSCAHQGTDAQSRVGYEIVMGFDEVYDYEGGFKKVITPSAMTSFQSPNGEKGWHFGNDNDPVQTLKHIDQWLHVAYVYDRAGNCTKLYVDADETTCSVKRNGERFEKAVWPNHGMDILVGADWGAHLSGSACELSSFFKGEIDDVHFYSKALTPDELQQDKDHFSATHADLVAAYDFDGMDKTHVPDITGHGHDAELHGLYIDNTLGNYEMTVLQSQGGTLTVMNGAEQIVTGSMVREGTELSIKATPDEGYRLAQILVNGKPYDMYILTVTAPTVISAEFVSEADLQKHTLSYEVIGHGAITVSNAEGTYESGAQIKHGTDDLNCILTPDYGATLTSLLINGQESIDFAFPSYGSNAMMYFLDPMNEDLHIVATFEGGGSDVLEHAVNYTLTEGGSITIKVTGGGQPALNSGDKVLDQSSLVCEITPDWGYNFVSVFNNDNDLTDQAEYLPFFDYYQLLFRSVTDELNLVFTFAPKSQTGIEQTHFEGLALHGQTLYVPAGVEATVYHTNGQLMFRIQGGTASIASLPAGTYIVRAVHGDAVQTLKFVKL